MKLELEIDRIEVNKSTAIKLIRGGKFIRGFEYLRDFRLCNNEGLENDTCKVIYKNNLSNIMMLEI